MSAIPTGCLIFLFLLEKNQSTRNYSVKAPHILKMKEKKINLLQKCSRKRNAVITNC